MLNKGFIRTFAILLGLISLYYLSFSVVSNVYNSKADKYADGDLNLKTEYLDSLSTEKVYLGYTLKESATRISCRKQKRKLARLYLSFPTKISRD